MTGGVRVLTLPPPPLDRREVLRYARAAEGDAATEALLDRVWAEAAPLFEYRCAYCVTNSDCHAAVVTVNALSVTSRDLAALLAPHRRAVVVAATVGARFERYLVRLSRLSPSAALMADALGTERVEALMDGFQAALAADGIVTTRRFSPGYGDLPLSFQREVFSLLSPEKNLGLSLGERLLMIPRKSVTALMGVVE